MYAGDEKTAEDGEDHVARNAHDVGVDFNNMDTSCFYCGDDAQSSPCEKCGERLCVKCDGQFGCYVEVNRFTPTPNQAEIVTFNKKRKNTVRHGIEKVRRQDDVICSTMQGRTLSMKKTLRGGQPNSMFHQVDR